MQRQGAILLDKWGGKLFCWSIMHCHYCIYFLLEVVNFVGLKFLIQIQKCLMYLHRLCKYFMFHFCELPFGMKSFKWHDAGSTPYESKANLWQIVLMTDIVELNVLLKTVFESFLPHQSAQRQQAMKFSNKYYIRFVRLFSGNRETNVKAQVFCSQRKKEGHKALIGWVMT